MGTRDRDYSGSLKIITDNAKIEPSPIRRVLIQMDEEERFQTGIRKHLDTRIDNFLSNFRQQLHDRTESNSKERDLYGIPYKMDVFGDNGRSRYGDMTSPRKMVPELMTSGTLNRMNAETFSGHAEYSIASYMIQTMFYSDDVSLDMPDYVERYVMGNHPELCNVGKGIVLLHAIQMGLSTNLNYEFDNDDIVRYEDMAIKDVNYLRSVMIKKSKNTLAPVPTALIQKLKKLKPGTLFVKNNCILIRMGSLTPFVMIYPTETVESHKDGDRATWTFCTSQAVKPRLIRKADKVGKAQLVSQNVALWEVMAEFFLDELGDEFETQLMELEEGRKELESKFDEYLRPKY